MANCNIDPKWISAEIKKTFNCTINDLPNGMRLIKLISKPKLVTSKL